MEGAEKRNKGKIDGGGKELQEEKVESDDDPNQFQPAQMKRRKSWQEMSHRKNKAQKGKLEKSTGKYSQDEKEKTCDKKSDELEARQIYIIRNGKVSPVSQW